MATVTKKELSQRIAAALGCTRQVSLPMADRLFDTRRQALIAGHRIEIRGFGVLEVWNTRPHPAARHPRTGPLVQVPARRKIHFNPGRERREAQPRPAPG